MKFALPFALIIVAGLGAQTPSPAPGDVVPVGTPGVVPPHVVSQAKPEYTAEAMRNRIQGAVRLTAIVERDGTVSNVEVTRSVDPQFGLDAAAVTALKQWRFTPGTLNGEPVRIRVTVDLTFTIRDNTEHGWPDGVDPAASGATVESFADPQGGTVRVTFKHPADMTCCAIGRSGDHFLESADSGLVIVFSTGSTPPAPNARTGQVSAQSGQEWTWTSTRRGDEQVWTYTTRPVPRITITCRRRFPPDATAAEAATLLRQAAATCASVVNSATVGVRNTP